MDYKSSTPSTCSYSMLKDTADMYWRLLGVKQGLVLDLASGMGGFGQAKPNDVDLYGVERDLSISSHSIGYTDIINIEIGEQKLPFENNKFRGILARDILEHLDKPWEVVDELYRVMDVGGMFICSVPKPDPKVVWNDYTHRRGFTGSALRSLVANSGFEVIDIFLMSGYTLAAKYKLSRYLPMLGHIPLLNNLFCSYHCIAVKK